MSHVGENIFNIILTSPTLLIYTAFFNLKLRTLHSTLSLGVPLRVGLSAISLLAKSPSRSKSQNKTSALRQAQ